MLFELELQVDDFGLLFAVELEQILDGQLLLGDGAVVFIGGELGVEVVEMREVGLELLAADGEVLLELGLVGFELLEVLLE